MDGRTIYCEQYFENANTVVQNNREGSAFSIKAYEISSQVNEISKKLESGCYDRILDTCSIELGNMITKFEHELSGVRTMENVRTNQQVEEKIKNLELSIKELKNGRVAERKGRFSNFLTKFSEVCTIIAAAPQLSYIAQNILTHIKTFLGI